jgi:hypothetical protein
VNSSTFALWPKLTGGSSLLLNGELRKRFPCASDVFPQRSIKFQNDFVPLVSIRGIYHLGAEFPDLIFQSPFHCPKHPSAKNFTVFA